MSKEKILRPIHVACGSDELRPIMMTVCVRNGYAYATDGHVLVKSNLRTNSLLDEETINKLDNGLIHKDVWKQLAAADSILIEDNEIIAHTPAGRVVFEFFNPGDQKYPDVNHVLNQFKYNKTDTIGINARMVNVLSKAFETDKLKFEFNNAGSGMRVTPMDRQDEFAILMPLLIQESLDL